jgi:hypothetical protein
MKKVWWFLSGLKSPASKISAGKGRVKGRKTISLPLSDG